MNPVAQEPPTPIPLLLLTSLRYLGRGLTFDDLAENTAMSEETVRVFLIASSIAEARFCMPSSTFDHQRVQKKLKRTLQSMLWQVSQAPLGVLTQRTFCSSVSRIVCVKPTLGSR